MLPPPRRYPGISEPLSGPEEGKIPERTPDVPNLGYSVHMELKKR